jgi:hypothetical protein
VGFLDTASSYVCIKLLTTQKYLEFKGTKDTVEGAVEVLGHGNLENPGPQVGQPGKLKSSMHLELISESLDEHYHFYL